MSNQSNSIAEIAQPFVCGGVSAMFASTCIHPIDLTKVRIQLSTEANPSAIRIIKNIIANEGPTGLYSGLSAALTRQATYGTARIGLHRSFSNKLVEMNDGKPIGFGAKAISGIASGAIAVCIGTPFDVALVRMQNDGSKPKELRLGYKNVFDALFRIAKEEGVLSLWRGLAPNILRGMSMNVGMMASYDQAKEIILKMTKDPNPSNPSLQTKLGSSAIAGFTCAFFSLPFDMMKSRLQNMRPDATGKLPYKGVLDCGVKILTKEGPLAFWRGFFAYYGRCAPHSMIILLSIEQVTQFYKSTFGLETAAAHSMVTAARFTSTGTVPNPLSHGDEEQESRFYGSEGDEDDE